MIGSKYVILKKAMFKLSFFGCVSGLEVMAGLECLSLGGVDRHLQHLDLLLASGQFLSELLQLAGGLILKLLELLFRVSAIVFARFSSSLPAAFSCSMVFSLSDLMAVSSMILCSLLFKSVFMSSFSAVFDAIIDLNSSTAVPTTSAGPAGEDRSISGFGLWLFSGWALAPPVACPLRWCPRLPGAWPGTVGGLAAAAPGGSEDDEFLLTALGVDVRPCSANARFLPVH